MGGIFSEKEKYDPKYNPKNYIKRCPGKNEYKIYKHKVYWRGEVVYEANGKYFLDLYYGYGKDSKNIFYKGFKLKTHDTLYFQVLTNKYAKNKENVFYRGIIIPLANIDSFKVSKNGIASDKYHIYNKGIKVKPKRSRS